MKRLLRIVSALIALVLLVGVSTKPIVHQPIPRLVSTVMQVNGTKAPGSSGPSAGSFDKTSLSGYMDTSDNTWAVVLYPASFGPLTGNADPTLDGSIQQGRISLHQQIDSTSGHKIIFCTSQGAAVCTLVKRDFESDPNAPPADDIQFVSVGDPTRPNGGIMARFPWLSLPGLGIKFYGATPDTQYKSVNVARQYDFVSDFPEDPANILAVVNAVLGGVYLHPYYSGVDLNSPTTTKQVHGNTTYYTAYTDKLPILQPFRDFAAALGRTSTPFLDAIEPLLRVVIEAGYNRSNYSVATPAQPGSSLPRLLNTVPQMTDAVKQGVESLASHVDTPAPAASVSVSSVPQDTSKDSSSEESDKSAKSEPKEKKPKSASDSGVMNSGNKFEPGNTTVAKSSDDASDKGSAVSSTSAPESHSDSSTSSGASDTSGASSGNSGSSSSGSESSNAAS
ncbi:MAG: hypothetical protein JWN75_174 [Candidatus Saccharibacteria bacterium]|nr:hypothetical protein [Candidatus Saccharibacteria bacterium]